MKILLLILCFSFSSLAKNENEFVHFKETNKLYLSAGFIYQSVTLETDESGSSETVDSAFTMSGMNISVDYFLSSNIALHFDYYFAMILDIDAEVQGFDLGLKYYLTDGASKEIEFFGSVLNSTPKLAYFLSANASTKDFQFATVSLKFQGVDLGVGADYHWNQSVFFRAEAQYEMLFNNNVRTYSALGFVLSAGYKF